MKPKITVLMSVYNGEKYIGKAMESILNQTFKDFEFLIINDGSTDRSENIIKSYQDPRIRSVNNGKNQGLIFSLNRGLELARGKYVARMDCDDISLPERLKKQYDYLEKNPEIVLIGSLADLIDQNGNKIGQRVKLPLDYYSIKFYLFFNNPLMHSSIFFRKKIIKDLGGYDEKYKHAEDYGLYTRIVKKYKVINLPEMLIKFRVHQESISQTLETKKTQDQTCQKIIFNYINYYSRLELDDFKIYNNVLNSKNLNLENLFKSLSISKKIYKSFLKKEKIDKKQIRKMRFFIYKTIIKNKIIHSLKKVPFLYKTIRAIYRRFFL